MAGTKLEVEGQQAFIAQTITSAASSIINSLEGINTQMLADGALCYVRDSDAVYRYDESSTAVANGTTVIAPSSGLGRWLIGTATQRVHAAIVTATARSTAPGQQPDIITSGALILLGFTVNNDDAFRQFKIPTQFVGNPSFHLHWSKTTDAGQQGNAVRWRVSYVVFNGVNQDAAIAPTVAEVEDVYEAADTTERIVYRTSDVAMVGFVAGYYISMKVEAVTPVGTPLTADPGLFSLDLIWSQSCC